MGLGLFVRRLLTRRKFIHVANMSGLPLRNLCESEGDALRLFSPRVLNDCSKATLTRQRDQP
jgi:hypothetical protein